MIKGFIKNFFIISIFSLSVFSLTAQGKKSIINTKVSSIDVHGNVNLDVETRIIGVKGIGASDIVNVKIGNTKFSCPVVKNYSDVDSGSYLLRVNNEEVSLAINMGNFAEATGAEVGTPVTISMREKYGYLSTYQLRLLTKSDERSDYASDEVFANFRQITLGEIAEGKLFRSTNPVLLDVRAPYASALMEANNITAVINLSDSEEDYLAREGTSPYYRKLYDEGKVLFLNIGASFGSEHFSEKIKTAFLFIASHPGESFLIHGKEGKNRTGYIVAILSALCDASLEEINNDYMLSYENYYGVKKNRMQYDEISQEVPYIFQVMNGGKTANAKKINSIAEKYLKNTIGLKASEIEAIKANLK